VRDVAVGVRSGGRYLFCVPWRDRSIVGTAYAPETTSGSELAEAFLSEARARLPVAGLTAATSRSCTRAASRAGLVGSGRARAWSTMPRTGYRACSASPP